MFDLSTAPFELVSRIYGEPGNVDAGIVPLVIGNLGWTVLGASTIWWRYRRIEVTK
jgi:hypothetical protein